MNSCPCGSGLSLEACCGLYLGGQAAPTAEALMRSRYSAYVLGDFDHIARTGTDRANRAFDRTEAEKNHTRTAWLGLTIERVEAGKALDTAGIVEFVFRYRENGREHAQRDISSFVRVDGHWRYDRSELSNVAPGAIAEAAALAPVGRNDPCPCGSGRKYKKCHGVAS